MRNAEPFSHRSLRFAGRESGSDERNILLCQNRDTRFLSQSVSVFGVHVPHIVGLRTDEKMGRIDACLIVATVADNQTSRDRPVHKLISESVSKNVPFASATFPKNTPSGSEGTNPKNATVCGFPADVFEETVNDPGKRSVAITVSGAVMPTTATEVAGAGVERELLSTSSARGRKMRPHQKLILSGVGVGDVEAVTDTHFIENQSVFKIVAGML